MNFEAGLKGLAFYALKENMMRKDFGVKTWLYPQPVLIVASYDENGRPNAMNAAWGGIYPTPARRLHLPRVKDGDELLKK